MIPFSNVVTMQDAAGSTANGTAIPTDDCAMLGMQVEGITSATITFEGTIDASTWYAIQVQNANNGTISTTTTADGLFVTPVAGLRKVRARISTYATGTITVTGYATSAGAGLSLADIDVAGTETVTVASITTLQDAIIGPADPTVDSYSTAVINLAASTADQVLVAAPAAGKQIWVYGLFMMADTAAGTVTLQDEDDTALSGTMAVSDEGGWVLPPSGNFAMPWIKCTTAKALEADTGACTVDGIIAYAIVDVS